MLLLKGKLKLSEKTKRVLPDRLGSFVSGFEEKEEDAANASSPLDFELGEELDTFHSNEHDPEIGIENSYDNKVDEESDLPVQVGRESLRKPVSVSAFDAAAEKQSELEFLLSREIINLERLQRIATDGLPDEGGSRATAWKLLLCYLPASRDMWERQLAENRLKYATMKDELLFNPSDLTRRKEDMEQDKDTEIGVLLRRHEISHGDHPLSDGKASIWYQYFKDAEIAEQIDRDLLRTHPNMKFFSGDSLFSRRNRQAMKNILLLFAKLNPEISYVQGMNEVLAPLYYLFITDPDEQNAANAEADSFSCFVRLLSDSVDHFCQQLDNSAVGIHSTLSHLMELLKANDEELWRHLEITNKVNPQFYAFRWITLLLTQEFNLNSIMRIWDSLLSNPTGVQEMLLRVCCAMLLCVRSRLLGGDFASNLKLLQHYPEINIEYLLQVAQKLYPSTSALPLTI